MLCAECRTHKKHQQILFGEKKWCVIVTLCDSGAGYTMDRRALQTFDEDVIPICKTEEIVSYKDSMVGMCFFRQYRKDPTIIRCSETSDEIGQ
jgi:hypothetical protein